MKGCDAYRSGNRYIFCTDSALRMIWSIHLWEQRCTSISAKAGQGQPKCWLWIISGWSCVVVLERDAAAGRGSYIYLCPLLRPVGFSQNPAFVSTPCHKIRLSYCRRKASACLYLLAQKIAQSAPFDVRREQRYNTLDFP